MTIRHKIMTIASGLLLALIPSSAALASSYNGTTVYPAADGQTYSISAAAGDVVTLANVGGSGSIVINFSSSANGTIVISPSSSLPVGVLTAPTGTVSTYYNVTLNGFSDSSISSATWNFSAAKSFINTLGLSASNIFLDHYTNSAWLSLNTTETSSDTANYYFSATTPSLSPFAIVASPGLTNTGFPYAVTAVAGTSAIAIIGAAFFLTKKRHSS